MSKEKYREQDYRLIGQATFDNTHSPCPDITHSVAYGQEFQIVERLDGSLEKLQSKNAWAMALIVGSNGQPLPNSRPKKVPLKFLAVKGSVETYTWYFAISELDQENHMVGTFLIRMTSDKTPGYVLSVVTKQRTTLDAAEIKHFKIVLKARTHKACPFKKIYGYKFDGASKRTYETLVDLVEEKTKDQGGLPCILNDQCRLTKDADYLETTYDELFWTIESNGLEIMETLGEGSFGTVKRARFKGGSSDFHVAAKFMKNQTGTMNEGAFHKETDLMKGLYDENVITLMGIINHDQLGLGIVTEIMDGSMDSAIKRMKDENHRNLRTVFKWICCIGSGMKYLSSKNILHRDLRTANVLVKNKIAKVSDFGISKIVEASSTLTHTPMPWRWTAPEVKEERHSRDHIEVTSKADVFSFGGLIYECLQYGEVPFKQRSFSANGTVGRNGSPSAELHRNMMRTKKTDLWKDGENKEIVPAFSSSKSKTSQKWGPSIAYLKKKSIDCTEFNPNSRPSFEDLNDELQRKYEVDYPKIHDPNSVSENDTYEGLVQIRPLYRLTQGHLL